MTYGYKHRYKVRYNSKTNKWELWTFAFAHDKGEVHDEYNTQEEAAEAIAEELRFDRIVDESAKIMDALDKRIGKLRDMFDRLETAVDRLSDFEQSYGVDKHHILLRRSQLLNARIDEAVAGMSKRLPPWARKKKKEKC